MGISCNNRCFNVGVHDHRQTDPPQLCALEIGRRGIDSGQRTNAKRDNGPTGQQGTEQRDNGKGPTGQRKRAQREGVNGPTGHWERAHRTPGITAILEIGCFWDVWSCLTRTICGASWISSLCRLAWPVMIRRDRKRQGDLMVMERERDQVFLS